jgi:hypothetical protein
MSLLTLPVPQKTTRQRMAGVLCLIVCVLFNVSALAEVVAHSEHAHSGHAQDERSHSSQAPSAHKTSAHKHAEDHAMAGEQQDCHGSEAVDASAAIAPAEASESDCVCEEVCCPSSAHLVQFRPLDTGSIPNAQDGVLKTHYRSITLDLVLPPPDFS